MNLIEIAGHLGADPEERFTPNGKRVVSFRVATRTRYKGQDDTIWWKVNIWGDRYDKMLPYLKKGSAVIVVGEMEKPETYVSNKDGSTQVSLAVNADIVKFSPFGKSDRSQNQESPYEAQASSPSPAPSFAEPSFSGAMFAEESNASNDNIPF